MIRSHRFILETLRRRPQKFVTSFIKNFRGLRTV